VATQIHESGGLGPIARAVAGDRASPTDDGGMPCILLADYENEEPRCVVCPCAADRGNMTADERTPTPLDEVNVAEVRRVGMDQFASNRCSTSRLKSCERDHRLPPAI
jgi:hypothetical protein